MAFRGAPKALFPQILKQHAAPWSITLRPNSNGLLTRVLIRLPRFIYNRRLSMR